jgi:hypothetical protein
VFPVLQERELPVGGESPLVVIEQAESVVQMLQFGPVNPESQVHFEFVVRNVLCALALFVEPHTKIYNKFNYDINTQRRLIRIIA